MRLNSQIRLFQYNEIKYLPDNYKVKVNRIYLYSALSISDLKEEYTICRLIHNILTSTDNEKRKKHPLPEWIPIKTKDLKQIVEACEDTLLRIKAYNEANILLQDIKYSLEQIISEDREHLGEVLYLLGCPHTTLNQILDLIDKVPNIPFKEACLLLYKFKTEEYYNQKIDTLETEKTKEINAIKKVLESQK